jgi:diguanylate cyclase (GGDEF)-like protein
LAINVRDFEPQLQSEAPDRGESARTTGKRWMFRVVGAVLIVAGFLIVSFAGSGGAALAVNAAVFGALGAYAYIAAAASRRASVDEEKRLRMELLVHNMELEKLTTKDDLTQLYNRRYFLERLERELTTAKGFGRPVSVLLIDIFGMKNINAEHGQRLGDAVLSGFGRFLLSQTRASDLPARIDGDRFGVILPDTAEDGTEIMIERLTKALSGTPVYEDNNVSIEVSVSLGVAGYPWSSETVEAVLQEAELSLEANERAKQQDAQIDPEVDGDAQAVPAVFRKSAGEDDSAEG